MAITADERLYRGYLRDIMDLTRYIQIGLIITFVGGALLLVPQVFNSDTVKKPLPLPSPDEVDKLTSGTEHIQKNNDQAQLRDGKAANRPRSVESDTRGSVLQQEQSSSTLQQGLQGVKPSRGSTGLGKSVASSTQTQRKQLALVSRPQQTKQPVSSLGTLRLQRTVCTKSVTLPQPVLAKIKLYLYFIGHPHSGHSIVGSILDSHPHIVVSHEFDVFGKLNNRLKFCNRMCLFNALWENSCKSTTNGLRTDEADKKGYTLAIDNLYQGVYQSYIDVIGDKRGGLTAMMYMKDPDTFESTFYKLKSIINMPMKVIHVIRNPYDNIATSVLFDYKRVEHVKITTLKESDHKQSIDPKLVDKNIVKYFNIYQAIEEVKIKYNLDVLEVHGKDLIADPKKVIMTMCDSLQVNCPNHFLSMCADKVFPEELKTRYKLKWTNDQISTVKMNIKKYQNLRRYLNFDS